MADENIFRFISLRPTKLEKEKGRLNMFVYRTSSVSPFYNEVTKAVNAGATREVLAEIATRFKTSQNYVTDFSKLKFPVAQILNWISDNGRSMFEESQFISSIEDIAHKSLKDIIGDADFYTAYNNLRDSVLADILTKTDVSEKEEKVSAIKVLYTIREVAKERLKLIDEEIIDEFFGRSTVIFPLLKTTTSEQSKPPEQPKPEEPSEEEKERKRKKERLDNLETAHRELSRMATDENFRYIAPENPSENARIKELEAQINILSAKCGEIDKRNAAASSINASSHFTAQEFILSNKAVNLLSNQTKQILTELHFENEKVNPVKAVHQIEEEIRYIQSNLTSDFTYNKMVLLGGTYVEKEKLRKAVLGRSNVDFSHVFMSFLKRCSFKSGIGDLLIVRQKIKAYELAEFAHVENALAGETREREHRRLNLREEIVTTLTETETEKERDLQSTERNEIQSEAEKIVQQQAHVEAGLQVSGSYGPSISFTASLNAGFSSSVEETQKKSTSYSREVTEKSSEKVRNRVAEERRRRVLEQTEEINKHKIDNSNPVNGHMRGIYRWLNKIYDAQIFNYGQRMMYEFVIPEPAAFYLYATVENPPPDEELIKPEAPDYYGAPLKPSNLTRTNYQNYLSRYNVTSAPEPPSQFTVKSYFDKQDGKDGVNLGRASAVSIPEGYEAYAATISYNSIFEQGSTTFARIMVGGLSIDRNYWGAEYRTFPRTFRGEISVTASLMNKWSFALGIDIFCSLTAEAIEKWQIKVYDAIMQGYLDQKAVYEARLSQREIQKGVEILGRNPIENRRIEKDELKKLIIMILTNSPVLNINSFSSSVTGEPVMDLAKVCQNGAYIRFFENAFEWQNIIYVFYPYFWGRHAKWIQSFQITDPDLEFAAFLKAGAVRVQVPVRPGFEKAIAFYCQTGIIWDGNDVPLIGDDLYVPIIKEITENLGKLDDGVPYPADSKPWEVTVPTSLVVLQDLEEIPNIRDILTGQNIDLRNQTS